MGLDASLQCFVGGLDRDLTVCLLVAFRMLSGNLSLFLETSPLFVYLFFCNDLSAVLARHWPTQIPKPAGAIKAQKLVCRRWSSVASASC